MKKGNAIALLPIGVFLCIYLGLGILFEYVMKIPMGFYNVPIIIAFLAAILVACLQNRKVSFDEKLEIMAQGLADKNIITMLLIFLTAGAFVGVVGRSSAESVAYFMLSLIPARFSVAVLFVVACFVSVAMGTSVGTITLITPIAVSVSKASLLLAVVIVGDLVLIAVQAGRAKHARLSADAGAEHPLAALAVRLRDVHGLKAPLQRGVLFDVLAVFLGRGGADDLYLAPAQGGL